MYPLSPCPAADAKVAAAAARGGGNRSVRFEQVATIVDTRLGLGALFGDGLGCKCSPDVVELVRTLEAARRSRKDGTKRRRPSKSCGWLRDVPKKKTAAGKKIVGPNFDF